MSKTIEEILAPKPEARPRIYAYSIDDKAHAGLLKVGQTTRNVKPNPCSRSAAFMPLHRPHAPPVSNTKESSALKQHKCCAPQP